MKLRPGFVGPLILLTVGFILLFNNFGILPWGIWTTLWHYWPVILILVGLEILARQTESRTAYFFGVLLCIVIIGGTISLAMSGVPRSQVHIENMRGADLNGTHLEGEDLNFAYLEGANLSSAHLIGADLNFANLKGANLYNANLSEANLNFADLENVNLSNSNLNDADLNFANLKGADLSGARLNGADRIGARTSHATICVDSEYGPCW